MAIAKHLEIRERLEADIRSGRFVVGEKLPTEAELMDEFGVSRNPVQKAMTALVEAGLVARRRGAGTVVASDGLRTNLLRMMDPTITSPEVAGEHRMLKVEVSSAGEFALSKGVFETKTPTVMLSRLKQSHDGLPLAYERCCIDLTKVPDVLTRNLEALTTIAYYNTLGIKVRRARTVLDAVMPQADIAEALQIDTSAPVIRQERTVYLVDEEVIEVAEFFIHPTNLQLEVSQIDNS